MQDLNFLISPKKMSPTFPQKDSVLWLQVYSVDRLLTLNCTVLRPFFKLGRIWTDDWWSGWYKVTLSGYCLPLPHLNAHRSTPRNFWSTHSANGTPTGHSSSYASLQHWTDLTAYHLNTVLKAKSWVEINGPGDVPSQCPLFVHSWCTHIPQGLERYLG